MRVPRPRTLAGQLALLVAVALFIAQAINFALLYTERRERTLNAVSAPAVARIVDAAERLAGDEPTRPRWARHVLSATSAVTEDMPRKPVLEARIADGLVAAGMAAPEVRVAELPASAHARWRRMAGMRGEPGPRRFALVSARLDPDRWINLPAPLPRPEGPLLARLLVQTVILYAAVLLAVLWLGRGAARSLDRLTRAAAGFGRSAGPVDGPLEPRGPEDIRRLTEAFNGMQGRIAAMLAEKDRMLGAIGHDLRTPLASLRVRAEAVEDAEERARMVETIGEMSGTLDDILTLARLRQSGETRRPVDLTALVDAVADDLRALGADVVFESSARLVLPLRPGLTRRAIRNLVENAVAYGQRARLRLYADGETAVVEIDDDGPGIPEDALEQAFEDFARLETSRSRRTGGAGLGLALAREIARGQGGDIVLRNRSDGGLRATLRLPIRPAE